MHLRYVFKEYGDFALSQGFGEVITSCIPKSFGMVIYHSNINQVVPIFERLQFPPLQGGMLHPEHTRWFDSLVRISGMKPSAFQIQSRPRC
jgi:hypothetical protein